jgi:hypothetical protein
MGNRGGRFHTADQRLGSRRWAGRRWICCVREFRGRHRSVWGAGYTELFFLDEVVALAAGHRPCFECRRVEARNFADAFDGDSKADAMDAILDGERRTPWSQRPAVDNPADLPDGAMVAAGDAAFAVRGGKTLRWSFGGYERRKDPPRGLVLLTPPSIVRALRAGYAPRWHASAD